MSLPLRDHMLVPLRHNTLVPLRHDALIPLRYDALIPLRYDAVGPLGMSAQCNRRSDLYSTVGVGLHALNMRSNGRMCEGSINGGKHIRLENEAAIFRQTTADGGFEFGVVGANRERVDGEEKEEISKKNIGKACASLGFLMAMSVDNNAGR